MAVPTENDLLRVTATDTVAAEREALLVSRAQRGEVAAYEELIGLYAVSLQSMLGRVLGNADDAAQLSRDAFVSAWRALPEYPSGTRFAPWLYRIALAEANGRLLDDGGAGPFDMEDAVGAAGPGSRSPSESEIRADIERFVAELPTGLRAAVVLRDILGLSSADAAQALGLEPADLKRRLHAARMAITGRLERRYGSAYGESAVAGTG